MPAGFGTQGLPPPAAALVSSLKPPTSGQPDALAKAAINAVGKLAAAAGHPLNGAPRTSTSGGGGGSSTTWILIALVVAALVTVAALIATRLRRTAA
jgi:hypothetical protein